MAKGLSLCICLHIHRLMHIYSYTHTCIYRHTHTYDTHTYIYIYFAMHACQSHLKSAVSLRNDVRFLTHTATKKQLWDRLAMIAGLPDSRETDIPFDFSLPEALLALCIFMRLKYSMPLFLLDTGGRSARALQLVSLLLRRRLQGFPVSQDFSGPSGSSLVVLECSWKIWSLHEHGAKILESMLAHLQRSNLDQPALGVLQAEPSMNALELLSRLPRTVREHLMLA